MSDERNCTKCKYGCLFDFGYSNYTVEGTEFFCAKKLHPDGHFDSFYSKDKRLHYAEQCVGFDPGEAIHMDVECENLEDLTPAQREIYDLCRAAS